MQFAKITNKIKSTGECVDKIIVEINVLKKKII